MLTSFLAKNICKFPLLDKCKANQILLVAYTHCTTKPILMYQKISWIALGIITLIIRYTANPEWIEQVYSRGLYPWIRKIMGAGLGWFPIPLIYVFFGLLIGWAILSIKRTNWRDIRTWKGLGKSLLNIGAFIGGGLFFFFFLWGFHYGRVPFIQQQGLQLKPIPVETLYQKLEQATKQVIELRSNFGDQTQPIDASQQPNNLESLARQGVQQTLQKLGYPSGGLVRGRRLVPKGIFLRFSSAGLYWPFVGEGNIDDGLHPIQQPFTLTHELAHGYGITNEGVCNFIAYLACQDSKHPFLQYSGMVAYWRYLAIAYRGLQPEKYEQFREQLPTGFLADMEAINETLAKYPDIMPRFNVGRCLGREKEAIGWIFKVNFNFNFKNGTLAAHFEVNVLV